jgi:valyl-tRNA synthetase
MVRHLALFNERPFNSVLINGMVLGGDGRKMSKSLKNYVAAPEALNKNGADAVRQWAAGGGATGSDIPYRAQDVEYGRRFLVKLWNASGFTANLLADYKPVPADKVQLEPLDKWIISKAEGLTKEVTDEFEKCQFNVAIEDVRNFTWHVLCDYYLEAVKDRLYNPDLHGSAKRLGAQFALYEVLFRMLQLLAPVTPHLTEEIYQVMYKEDKGFESLQVSQWPKFDAALVDEESEKNGDLIIAIIGEVRHEKAEKKLPLNAPVKSLVVYAGTNENAKVICSAKGDIAGTLKVTNMEVLSEKRSEGRQVSPYDVYIKAEY